jgi:hypothetical protein
METIWDRTRQAFEKLMEEAEKTAERMVDGFEELGDVAKARFDQARLERALFKRFAEIGSAVYELQKKGVTGAALLEDPSVKVTLQQAEELERDIKQAESRAQRTK